MVAVAAVVCAGAAKSPGPIMRQAEHIARHPELERNRTPLLISVSRGLSEMGMSERARQVMLEALEQAPRDPSKDKSLSDVAGACAETGMFDLARKAAASVTAGKMRIAARLQVAGSLIEAGRPEAATELAEEALAEARRHPHAGLRVQWLGEAAEQARSIGRTERAQQLLTEALRQTEQMANRSSAAERRADLARRMARLGNYQQALGAAELLGDASLRARVVLRIAAIAAGRAEPSADQLWQRAEEQAAELTAEQWGAVLEAEARTAIEAGSEQVALQMTQKLERVARRIREIEQQDEAVRTVRTGLFEVSSSDDQFEKAEALYGELGRWQEAARLAALREDGPDACRYRARAAVQLWDDGETEPARAFFADIDPRHVRYVTPPVMSQLARIHVQLHPEATVSEVAALKVLSLRSALAGQHAVSAALKGETARAGQFLRAVQNPGMRSIIARDTITEALSSAGREQLPRAIEYARLALRQVRSDKDRPALLFLLGQKLAQAGDTEGAVAVARQIETLVEPWMATEAKANTLGMLSALRARAGLTDQAVDAAREAVATVHRTNCASCRYESIAEMFEHLYAAGDVRVLMAALQGLEAPDDRVTYALRALSELPDVSEADRRSLLQVALDGSTESWSERKRVSGLLRVAATYREHGLQPGATESEILSRAPDVYVPASAPVGQKQEDGDALLVYFTREGCALCREAEAILGQVMSEENYRGRVARYDVATDEGARLNKALCVALEVPPADHGLAPALFNGKRAIVGREIDERTVRAIVQQTAAAPSPLSQIEMDAPLPGQSGRRRAPPPPGWRAPVVGLAIGATLVLAAALAVTLMRRMRGAA